MIQFEYSDYIVIILYFIFVLIIGLKSKSTDNSTTEYIVAGRRLTLPAFVATLVSTFYGGILGIGEFTYRYGISGWLLYALPNYLFTIIFAFYLAKRIRKSELLTIPDKLENVYGKKVSLLGAVYVFILMTPAPYLFMMGIIVNLIFDINLTIAYILCIIVSVLYLFKGGLLSDVNVNIFEFILMFVGFGLILPFCMLKLGGFEYLALNLPAGNLNLYGNITLPYFFIWFFIGAWALVDPTFHQRCYAAKSDSVAQKGVLISIIFWIIFDLLTTTAGLYASAYFKNLNEPSMSYPLLGNIILPPLAKGIFFIGIIATIMSTLHSYIFVSSTTFGKDILSKISGRIDIKNNYSKLGIILTSLLSILIVILIPSVVQIWYTIGTLCIPPLLIGVLSSYTKKFIINNNYIFSAMLFSFILSLISFIYGYANKLDGNPVYLMNIEPFYPGILTGIIIYTMGLTVEKTKSCR